MKTSEHYLLAHDEHPRQPVPFPTTNACPKCGTVGGFVYRPNFARCFKCGYVNEIPVTVKPLNPALIRDETFHQAGGNPLVDAICEKCGAEYRTYARRPATRCCKCRQGQYRLNYKTRLKSRLAASSAERAAGVVLPVADSQCQTKEVR